MWSGVYIFRMTKKVKLYFMGIPIMRMTTASTAFKMPLYGVGLPLSAFSVSSTVFRNPEKLSCANENERKQAIGEVCFYPTEIFTVTQSTLILIFKTQILCALKNSIDLILQPRNPALDYRGCFYFSLLCQNQCYIPH